jgi:hypothetical protein
MSVILLVDGLPGNYAGTAGRGQVMGTVDVQVSELNPSLVALVKQIRTDSYAISHLAAFLGGLDEASVRKHLLGKRDE